MSKDSQLPEFAKRLLMVADKLDSVPDMRFDYTKWVGPNWQGKEDLSCGTTACAFGHASTIPELRALGLRLLPVSRSGWGNGVVGMTYANLDDSTADPWHIACEAGEVIFGLTVDEMDFVFTPDDGGHWEDDWGDEFPEREKGLTYVPRQDGKLPEQATAKEVAQHIRNFVEAKVNSNDEW